MSAASVITVGEITKDGVLGEISQGEMLDLGCINVRIDKVMGKSFLVVGDDDDLEKIALLIARRQLESGIISMN